jgi:hypothetical protein
VNALDTSENNFWDKFFKKNEDIVSRKIAGELFLVPVKGKLADMQQLYTLNPVAEYIWQELGAQKSQKDILDGIIEEFNVTKEEADSDLQEFVSELLEAGLIKE